MTGGTASQWLQYIVEHGEVEIGPSAVEVLALIEQGLVVLTPTGHRRGIARATAKALKHFAEGGSTPRSGARLMRK